MSDAPTSHIGTWLLTMILIGVAMVSGVVGGFLMIFCGAAWLTQAGSGGHVNPNTPLLTLIGIVICGIGTWAGISAQRMLRRAA